MFIVNILGLCPANIPKASQRLSIFHKRIYFFQVSQLPMDFYNGKGGEAYELVEKGMDGFL